MMRRIGSSLKRLLLICLSVFLATGIWSSYAHAASDEIFMDSNQNRNYYLYGRYGRVVNSYLVPDGTSWLRLQAEDNVITIEKYDSNFNFQSSRKITEKLPFFGGFYASDNAYYVVTGQDNDDESDKQEVIRVTKYDKNWNSQGYASLKGANTVAPFDFGSLRMAEYDGYLYVRTCHLMYASSDGKNHQGNITVVVKESDMSIAGYTDFDTSHSFNQFIFFDDIGNLITLDHGDANPDRGALLRKFFTEEGESYPFATGLDNGYFDGDNNTQINTLAYQGEKGDNETRALMGGLDYSSSSYLTAGSSARQDTKNPSADDIKNVYITVTDRNNFSDEGTAFKWITSYKENGNISASCPQLVKISDDSFLLMWTQIKDEDYTDQLSYVFLDGKGKTTSSIFTTTGGLSDCKPVVSNGKVVWYVTDGSKLIFYSINNEGILKKKTHYAYDTPKLSGISNTSDGVKISWKSVKGIDTYRVFRKTGSEGWKKVTDTSSTSFVDKKAKEGTTYTYTVRCYDDFLEDYVSNYDSKGLTIKRLSQPSVSLKNTSSGVKVSWKKIAGASGYYVYRKTDGDYSRIGEVTSGSKVSYTDKTAKSGTTYTYTVRAYSGSSRSSYAGKKIKFLTQPNVSSASNTSSGITVKWKKVSGASGYYVYRKTPSGDWKRIKEITSGSTVSYKDTAVKDKNGTTYLYTVKAYSGSYISSYMSGKKTVRLKTPSISGISNSSGKKMTVQWSKNSSATGYQIKYVTGDTSKTITIASASTVKKVISGLSKGKTYTVYVRAYKKISDVNYYSGWSSGKKIKISK